jgi:hypothetical protein
MKESLSFDWSVFDRDRFNTYHKPRHFMEIAADAVNDKLLPLNHLYIEREGNGGWACLWIELQGKGRDCYTVGFGHEEGVVGIHLLRDSTGGQYSHRTDVGHLGPDGGLLGSEAAAAAAWMPWVDYGDPLALATKVTNVMLTCGTWHLERRAGLLPVCTRCPNQLSCMGFNNVAKPAGYDDDN